jgi:two-component system, OmpR family, response regulator
MRWAGYRKRQPELVDIMIQQQRKPAVGVREAAALPLRLVLVEDSKVLTERLVEAMRQIPGIELSAAVDTENAACAVVARERVDVMILDLHLRQGTGFGVLRALAKSPEKPCIIVLTNYDLPQYRDEALGLGAAHFMDKVRDYHKLPDVLHELVAEARSRA